MNKTQTFIVYTREPGRRISFKEEVLVLPIIKILALTSMKKDN